MSAAPSDFPPASHTLVTERDMSAAVSWPDPGRREAFERWLNNVAAEQALRPDSLRIASADASFRRYLRLDTLDGGTRIVMDAPPAHENCAPFVHVAALMHGAGLNAPELSVTRSGLHGSSGSARPPAARF